MAALLSTASPAADRVMRPLPQAACAALDLHVLWQIEDAAVMPAVAPEQLLAAVEGLMSARKLCQGGDVAQALETYDGLDLGLSRVRWLQ
jgi:hypothetical protein